MNDTAIAMGQSFDTAKNGDLFYLPPGVRQPDFKIGLEQFLSPTEESAQFFITHGRSGRSRGHRAGGPRNESCAGRF